MSEREQFLSVQVADLDADVRARDREIRRLKRALQKGKPAEIPYEEFLAAKVASAPAKGFSGITPEHVNPACKPHVRAIVPWLIERGSAACFSLFGLQKTSTQLETVRLILERAGGNGLIVCPLNVVDEFKRDAEQLLGWPILPKFIRTTAEISGGGGIYITNWESVREGKLDPAMFTVATFDEADTLRSFGSKTFSEVVIGAWKDIPYRFCASATPDPNDYIELLGYAQFLGAMDIGEAKTRFFRRNSEKADELTLHPHKEAEFWAWVASWAIVIQRPSDLGFSDEGYDLPELEIRWHMVESDHTNAGVDQKSGQARIYKNVALGITHASREKRESLGARVAKMMELRAEDPGAHRLIWHDLEEERKAIEKAIPGVATVYGTQHLGHRSEIVRQFADGEIPELASKPVLLGAGNNFQRHCSWAIFMGIGYKFRDLIQAIHRIHRYGQKRRVRIDLIYTEAEQDVRRQLEAKWARYKAQTANLAKLIRECGLAEISNAARLTRAMGLQRQEAKGEHFTLVNADTVTETATMEENSVGLILTSLPFSNQYEYTPSYNDFGHTDDAEHFWQQMDYLTPHLLRVLQPGRNALIHVKDRVVDGGMTGLGFQTVNPFHADAITHFTRHGFIYLGQITIVTDVVRENAGSYRLGDSMMLKDGSRMGAGMPEYLLIFRKAPTDNSNGFADVPVAKVRSEYSRAAWQFDAHGFWRSAGDRLLTPEEIGKLSYSEIFKLYRQYSETHVYNFGRDVELAEVLEHSRPCKLPPDFMLMQPVSVHPDVWTDIVRMRTLNGSQRTRNREKHICPFQFDIVDRAIVARSMPGELVFDPFAGLGTVPLEAVKLGRRGRGHELNANYWADSVAYCREAERDRTVPTLFDALESGALNEDPAA